MNQARVGLLVAAALLAAPLTASAQSKKGGAGSSKAEASEQSMDDEGDLGGTPEESGSGEEAAPPSTTGSGAASAGSAGEGEDDLCKLDPTACGDDLGKAAERPISAQMYAVQQVYAMRVNRVELNPYFGLTMNDQFVSHPAPGLAANYYLSNSFALGVNGNVYAGLNSTSDFNFQTGRAARVGGPITEYAWNANVNLHAVPAYGKFAGFGDFIFHYDFFVVAGGGMISTRPIAVIDPDNRSFSFKPKPNAHLGGGLRVFLNRWAAVMLEVSDYVFMDELENPVIADGLDGNGRPLAQDSTTWLASGTSLTNNVQAQVGVSMFLPFDWKYRLPK